MLKTKMFVAFSIVSLVIVGLTCGIFYQKYTNDIQQQALHLSSIITKQYSDMVDLYMQSIDELALSVSISSAVQNNLMEYGRAEESLDKEIIDYRLSPYLFDFSYPKPYIHSISIHTLDGYMYAYSKDMETKFVPPYTREEMTRFDAMLEDKKFILHLYPAMERANIPPQHIVSFVRRIHRIPTQQTIGHVVININVNAFDALASTKMNDDDYDGAMTILLVNDNGEIVYDNTGKNEGQKFEMDSGTGPSSAELRWDNASYFFTKVNSAYTGWETVVLLPKDVVLNKQAYIRDIIAVAGIAAMIIVAAVSYTLSHQITMPLRHLIRNMSSVEHGDFTRRMTYAGNNEFGKLSRVYNHMLDSITRLIREVYESKLAEKNAQLAALQAQINPHFLYNTLNTMKSISRLRGVEEVAEISESLASLFQYSMKHMSQPVLLRDELEHIGHYFNIQQHRFGNRLTLELDVPEQLQDAVMLKLTLQPIVENAVNHGLARMKSGGKILIEAKESGGTFILLVTDNGKGLTHEQLYALRKGLSSAEKLQDSRGDGGGIGLANIHQRIQLYYGNEYGIEVNSTLGAGTTIRIEMPAQ